jgi:serine phosphatase RsbU (regulator of sigma subunit)
LIEIIRANRAGGSRAMADAIRNAVSSHAADDSVFDDLTLVVLKRNPA